MTQPKIPCWKRPVQVAHKSLTDTTSIFCLQPCTESLESNINACISKGTTLWCIICSTGPNGKRFLPFLSITVLLLLVNGSSRSIFFTHIFFQTQFCLRNNWIRNINTSSNGRLVFWFVTLCGLISSAGPGLLQREGVVSPKYHDGNFSMCLPQSRIAHG